MDHMGIALDLTGRAVDVGYVGARVAVDTWLRWIGLASRLSVTAFGQGVAAIRGVDTARPVMDVFDAYLAQLADLPGRAGKAFELEWEATRAEANDPQFRALLVPDAAFWRHWTDLAGQLAKVSTTWRRKRRSDEGYAERLVRVAGMPVRAAGELHEAATRLHAMTTPRNGAAADTVVPLAVGPGGRGIARVVERGIRDTAAQLGELTSRETTPDRVIVDGLVRYSAVLTECADVAIAMGREYDRCLSHYNAAGHPRRWWVRDQPDVDGRLGRLLDAQAQRLAAPAARVGAQEMREFLTACEQELGELSAWPVRSARASNAAVSQEIRSERRRQRAKKRRA